MDLKKLKYFLTVAREGSITKAAQSLYMAQPPLSYQLKALEEELGVQLIEKDGRNIRLTEHGRFLAEKGPAIIELVNKTTQDLRHLNISLQQIFTIGNASPWGYTILPHQIKKLNDPFPDISFQLWQDDTYRIMDLLNNGEIEVAFVTLPTNPEIYESRVLNTEPAYAFFGSLYHYGNHDDYITLNEVAKSTNIIVHNHMYDLFNTYYRRIGLKPKISCYNATLSMLDWVTSEPWIIIGPKSIFDIHPRSDIQHRQIIHPMIEIVTYITWRKDHNFSNVARYFIDSILDKFQPITRATNTEVYQMLGDPNWLNKRLYSNDALNKKKAGINAR